MSLIVLVRHGETEGESSIRLNGSTDVALNDVGRAQMREVGDALRELEFEQVITSPLWRSREGARLVVGDRGPAPHVVEAFTEIDFGDWERLTHAEAAQRDPHNHARWRSEGRAFRFPGGESRQGFHDRVAVAVPRVFADPSLRTLGVLHKGVIKIILAELLGLSFEEYRELPVELASIHRLRREGDRWVRA